MKLIRLSLNNFMGSGRFTLEANGQNVSVFGKNGTGKTTLASAFSWLLFGKDSLNRKDFSIKTLDSDNNALSGLDHEVEATFEIDGKQVTLKKVFKEKWTTKRGSGKTVFSGHTNEYYINDIPKPEKDYDTFVSGIAPEETFKILTNPLYFSETLKWEKRRELLLEVCGGDVSDSDVINSDKRLSRLAEIISDHTVEDHKELVKAKQKKINETKKSIPVRIDEANRALPNITGLNAAKIAADLAEKRAVLQVKQQELADMQNGGDASRLQKQLREIEAEILKHKNADTAANQKAVSEKRKELSDAYEKVFNLESEIRKDKGQIEDNNKKLKDQETIMIGLRVKWHEVNKQEFTLEQPDTCPTCGQSIPEEQLEETRQKALEKFNLSKSVELERISNDGKYYSQNNIDLKSANANLQRKIDTAQTELATAKDVEAKLTAEIDKLQNATPYNPEITILEGEKKRLNEEIASLANGSQNATDRIKTELETLNGEIIALESSQLRFKSRADGEKRIADLKQQERTLAAEYERLEGELFLCDLFVKAKVNLLEGRINSKFKIARFKLFNVQINQGIDPCCEVLGNGVPFNSGLNAGARIQIGLDIIATLCDHYNFYPPIWIDNRESVIEIPEMRNQVVNLFVSAEDPRLRVEQEENEYKEAV